MREEQTYQLIDRYLKNKLSSEELKVFEKRLESDKEFAGDVNSQKLADELLVENRFFDIMDQMDKPSGGSDSKGKFILGGIALLLIAGLFFFQLNSPEEKVIQPIYTSHTEKSTNKETIIQENKISENIELEKSVIKKNEKPVEQKKAGVKIEFDSNLVKVYNEVETQKIPLKVEVNKITTPIEINKCANVTITAEVVAQESCKDTSTGMIEIPAHNLKGGKHPYVFSLNNDYQISNIFTSLLPGRYDVKIKDINGCTTIKKEIIIGSKTCINVKSYSFNPVYETWKFPVGDNQNFKIKITNKEGIVVYATEVTGGTQLEWNGTSLTGSELPSGAYLYVIELPDGKTNQGYISIIK